MGKIVWDEPKERRYEIGLDHGVLYPLDSEGVPWNGLVSVEDSPTGGDVEPLYFDGYKYFDFVGNEEFQATLSAFTYPAEFEACLGHISMAPGMYATGQVRQSFGLVWRTKTGNALDGESGYKLHLLYNATAVPGSRTNETDNSSSPNPVNFQWTITAVPRLPGEELNDPNSDPADWVWPPGYGMPGWPVGPDGNTPVPGWRSFPYIIIDSTEVDPIILDDLEGRLNGTDLTPPYLPTQLDVLNILNGQDVPVDPTFPWTPPGPTYGDWQAGPQLSVGAGVDTSSMTRYYYNGADDIRSGSFTAAQLDAVFNEKRKLTDGGSRVIGRGFAGAGFESSVGGNADYSTAPSYNFYGFSASDYGLFYYAKWFNGWYDYVNFIAQNMPANATGYEIEGGDAAHIVSVDEAILSLAVQTVNLNSNPKMTMTVDIQSKPAQSPTDANGTITTHETRVLSQGPINVVQQPNIELLLSSDKLAQSTDYPGGVMVFPFSHQADATDWETGGGSNIRASFKFQMIDSTDVSGVTYKVTFPRYRYIF